MNLSSAMEPTPDNSFHKEDINRVDIIRGDIDRDSIAKEMDDYEENNSSMQD